MSTHVSVGRIAALYRYPVKSMAAQSVTTIAVGWYGFAGDRRWAFVRDGLERSGFPWVTIREKPGLWQYQPWFTDENEPDTSVTMVRTPSGLELDVVDPLLATELGFGARVIRQGRGVFDAMPLSLTTTATITRLSSIVGEKVDALRFRPNIVVEATEPFAEDRWVGKVLRAGDVEVRIDRRDKRCVVVNVDPGTGARNPEVLRAIAQHRDACLGVYGTTVAPGSLAVGDEVFAVS